MALDAHAIRAGLSRGDVLCPECGRDACVHREQVRVCGNPTAYSAALAAARVLAEECERLERENEAWYARRSRDLKAREGRDG
jgi:transposase-like protein